MTAIRRKGEESGVCYIIMVHVVSGDNIHVPKTQPIEVYIKINKSSITLYQCFMNVTLKFDN